MKIRLGSLFLLVVLSVAARAGAQDHERDPFRIQFNDAVLKVQPGDSFSFAVAFKVPKGFYLYDEKTSVLFNRTEDFSAAPSTRSKPEQHFDPFLKKNVPVFFNDFEIKIDFRVPADAKPGRRTLEGIARYQGCSEDFCYRPQEKIILLPVEVTPREAVMQSSDSDKKATVSVPEAPAKPSFWAMIRETNPEKLLNQGKVKLLALAFFGGMITSITPCVLPIIPLTLAFIGVKKRRRGNILRAAALVLGMVLTYSLLGFLAASLGLKLGFLFQSRWFVLLIAVFFLVFALGLFEIIPFHLPPKLHQRLVRLGGEGPRGAFVAGMTIGLIASPCVGPLIGPLLLIAAREQDRLYGFMLLFTYGLGMGALFLLLSSSFAELASKVKGGKWTHVLKRGLGILMFVPAIYYGSAFAAPYFQKPDDKFWVKDLNQALSQAKSSKKPVLIDFYADWCPPCMELDKFTFSTPEVRAKAKEFVMLKVDCSDAKSPSCVQTSDRFEVVGMPTVLFLKSDGSLIPDVRLVGGFADKEQMVLLMQQALDTSK